jgi:hypothetical protein
MADDSAAVEVVWENANPSRILGSGLNWGDHICVSVCCRRIGSFCPTDSKERICMGRHVGHRGMDPPRPKQAAVIVTDGPQPPIPAAVLGRHVTRSGSVRRKSVLDILSGSKTRSRVLGQGDAGDILDELA